MWSDCAYGASGVHLAGDAGIGTQCSGPPPKHQWEAQVALLPNMDKQTGTVLLISSQLNK